VKWFVRLDAAVSRVVAGAGRSTLAGLAVASLGLGVMWGFGHLSRPGLLAILVSALLALLALGRGRWRQGRGWWVVLVAICGLTNVLSTRHFLSNQGLQVGFALLLTVTAAGAVWLPSGRRAAALLGLAFLSVVGVAASAWSWGSMNIDVGTALSGAAEALIHGHNPYGPVFKYFVEAPPGYVWGHFAYGPSVPLLAVPGRLLGDIRMMSVACMAATVAGIWWLARQGEHAADAHRVAALAIASPLWVGMILNTWVDVYMMVGIVWWLALRRDHRGWSIALLSIGLMVKFTSLLLVVPAFIWSRRGRVEVVAAVVISVAAMVPFALLTGVHTYLYSLFGYQLALPFRTDSLSLSALLYQLSGAKLPTVLPLLPVAAAIAWVVWRRRARSEGDLALQAAALNIAAFLLAKQAFFNYYFASEIMLLAGIAGAGVAIPASDVGLPAVIEAPLRGLRRRFGSPASRPIAAAADREG